MRISYEWLGEYVDTSGLAPAEAAELLTMTGTKVESITVVDLSAIIVGRVLEQREHPRSNKPLWIHQVDVGGGQTRQIVAGAPNAVAGTLVPVALPGTRVPSGTLVRDGRIAGEAAQGMLCSADELLLAEEREPRIMLLDRGEPGESLTLQFPVEAVFETEITPNRPDCLGHFGVARELAAATGRELKMDFMPSFTGGIDPPGTGLVEVTIEEPDLCARYIGAPITGVTVRPSPDWMQRRLRAAGVRPISNLVDITAYVMLEYGQPLHVFDLARVEGPEMRVRRARAGERLLCLDGQVRNLDQRMLVIADRQRPMAIAGLIGGEESGVGEGTTSVLLESANFDGVNIRATSRAFSLRTEASSRFEKGIAPELALAGARRAATLIVELAGGQVHRDWPDQYPRPQQPVRIRVEPQKVDGLLGVHVPRDESQAILGRLGFHLRVLEDGAWDVLPPVFRLDVSLPEDIIEEVGRIHGIDRIPATLPGRRRSRWVPSSAAHLPTRVREVLLGAGFDEAVSPALVSRRVLERLGLAEGARTVINPMSDEMDTMRTSLLPSLLLAEVLNQNRSGTRADLFELSRVYRGTLKDGRAEEPNRLAAVARVGGGHEAGRDGVLRLKSALDRIAGELATGPFEYAVAAPDLFHPGRSASIRLAGAEIGSVGELHPRTLAVFDLDGRAVAFDLDADALLAASGARKATGLPRFPSVDRDLALLVPDAVSASDLVATIRAAGGDLLESASAFDEYRSEQLGEGVRSLAFALTFRSPERTLTDSEVDSLMALMRARLETAHAARPR
ncbi:MAG TPA: phenylalanine--tRNA ligase subunit beta [Candidatus Dormibacteraeota bacterium]|nr:phenylalanine--tRNA ligase subunit beta [Candidatus Dormibacteraeota bacterium]